MAATTHTDLEARRGITKVSDLVEKVRKPQRECGGTLGGVITALRNASSSRFPYTDTKCTGNREGNRWHTETEMELLGFTVKNTSKMRKGGSEERNLQQEKPPHTSSWGEKQLYDLKGFCWGFFCLPEFSRYSFVLSGNCPFSQQ